MEATKNKKISVALFIILGLVLLVVAVFIIGSKENLFTPTFKLQAAFEKVNGLKEGASVRFNGINVGTVNTIEIFNGKSVVVRMTIDKKVQAFIKKDSKASVSSEGLVGNKIIEITSGTNEFPSVEGNEVLQTIPAVETEDIMRGLKESSENAANMTKDLQSIVGKINGGEGTIGAFVNDKTIYTNVDLTTHNFADVSVQFKSVFAKVGNTVDNVSVDVKDLSRSLKKITDNLSSMSDKMNSGESVAGTFLTDTVAAQNLKELIRNANNTSKNLEDGSFSFSQNMEALKHNFLFKGYFEDIGYFDKTDWEKKTADREFKLKIREQEVIKKEQELKDLEQRLKQNSK